MSLLAIIPARGGSKGIPRKNLALCGGRPLVDWTIDAANHARSVDAAILSSDDEDILSRAAGNVRGVLRPPELAADDTPTEAVMEALVSEYDAEAVVLLQPTSPLRTGAHVDEAVQMLRAGNDCVLSVVPSHAYLWDGLGRPLYRRRLRRQEMWQFEENGAIYAFTMAHWLSTGDRLGGLTAMYVMGEEQRYQVDSPLDLAICSLLLERRAARSEVEAVPA